MAEMILSSPDVKSFVDEYDFTFLNGMMMPVVVNTVVGDTISIGESVVRLYLCSKPSLNNPEKMLPAENITIYTQHLVTLQHRVREIVALSPKQQYEWAQTLKGVTGTTTVN